MLKQIKKGAGLFDLGLLLSFRCQILLFNFLWLLRFLFLLSLDLALEGLSRVVPVLQLLLPELGEFFKLKQGICFELGSLLCKLDGLSQVNKHVHRLPGVFLRFAIDFQCVRRQIMSHQFRVYLIPQQRVRFKSRVPQNVHLEIVRLN